MADQPNGACSTLGGRVHKYQFDYSDDTAAGRLVALLSAHATPGVVVDLGCGTAELAAPLTAAGFQYVGFDLDADVVRSLVAQGIDARVCDLAVDDPAQLVAAALAGRTLAAVTAIDVVEHVPGFDRLLAALSSTLAAHGALLGVSVPNVAHEDLAVKLLAGRWDVTDIGLLDATHLNLFDERRLAQAMDTAGFEEVDRNDVDLLRTEQGLLREHPFVDAHSSVGEWLRRLRDLSAPHATTYQFVRVYRARAAGPAFSGVAPTAPVRAPTITVVVLPGDEAAVASTLESLAAQGRPAEHVLVAPSADLAVWLASTVAAAATTHGCAGDPGPRLASAGWHGFAAVRAPHPARVARHAVHAAWPSGPTQWSLTRTLTVRDEPTCAFAVPVAPARWLRLFDAAAPDPWWAWMVRTASMVGFVDVTTAQPLPAVAPRAMNDLLPVIGADALLLPAGWHHDVAAQRGEIQRLGHELAAANGRADAASATVERMRSSVWWRLGAPGRMLARRLRR